MIKEEFESYINPIHLTFESFNLAIESSSLNVNVDSAIVKQVLNFDDNSPAFSLSTNECAILLAYSNILGTKFVSSSTLATGSSIFLQNVSIGSIFVKAINPPVVVTDLTQYMFLIIRFN